MARRIIGGDNVPTFFPESWDDLDREAEAAMLGRGGEAVEHREDEL